jgi:hypothetical protein
VKAGQAIGHHSAIIERQRYCGTGKRRASSYSAKAQQRYGVTRFHCHASATMVERTIVVN